MQFFDEAHGLPPLFLLDATFCTSQIFFVRAQSSRCDEHLQYHRDGCSPHNHLFADTLEIRVVVFSLHSFFDCWRNQITLTILFYLIAGFSNPHIALTGVFQGSSRLNLPSSLD